MRRIFTYPDICTSVSDSPIAGSNCFAHFDKYCDEPTEAELAKPGIILKTSDNLAQYEKLRDAIEIKYCDTEYEHNTITNDVIYNNQHGWKIIRYCVLQTCLALMVAHPQSYHRSNQLWTAERGYVLFCIPAEVCDVHLSTSHYDITSTCHIVFRHPEPDSGFEDDLYPVVSDVINNGQILRTTWLFLKHHCYSGLFHKVIEEPVSKEDKIG